ncbi:MAG: asparagine synthase (glutamine-hydrolyzing), partial [Cytophagales bacterium]|nr:asparagine synthase (glutamine-hydrolyzing) [Cytophagales bacterium]
ESANQPFVDSTGRYALVFNGEIFNYVALRNQLIEQGQSFFTASDTEVLFRLLITHGVSALNKLNGFFAFAFYDSYTEELILARDRFGVKPLLYYQDEKNFVFASEMKALLEYSIPKELDHTTLHLYLQLNYVPGNNSILKGIQKVPPGHWIRLNSKGTEKACYYTIPNSANVGFGTNDYSKAKEKLIDILDDSVRMRLEADVPLGLFLSGGIDSSVITALASRHSNQLNTFSVGYKDNLYYDETSYAELVAKKFNTHHTVFSLSSDDLLGELDEMLDYIDEPFADSSALAVYILSKRTSKKVKVALSGDGADEIFSGYNKHLAEWNVQNNTFLNLISSTIAPIFPLLPKSRGGPLSDYFRKMHRYEEGRKLSIEERYWRWCSISTEIEANSALNFTVDQTEFNLCKRQLLSNFSSNHVSMDSVLRSDVQMVLANDMLVKVDMMSMANGLEIRNPFLDYRVVEFAFSLPESFKINGKMKKRIVQDAFRDILPKELYNRPKHGFEIPLLQWMRRELQPKLDIYLDKDFIAHQRVFSYEFVSSLRAKLASNNPGDTPAQLWAILVFQHWWKNYM